MVIQRLLFFHLDKVTVEPENVTVSDDASVATKFTFPSPVYMQQDIEYCFVIMANTQDYMIWLSHMGDTEVGGTRTISDQPYAGVLFKSQNASTWTASQMEDLKFVVRRASFTTTWHTYTTKSDTTYNNIACWSYYYNSRHQENYHKTS